MTLPAAAAPAAPAAAGPGPGRCLSKFELSHGVVTVTVTVVRLVTRREPRRLGKSASGER